MPSKVDGSAIFAVDVRLPGMLCAAIRAAHVPLAIFVVTAAVFVRLHFGTGRTGLLAAIVVLRLATLVLDFTSGVNVNFEQVTGLAQTSFWGGAQVSVPLGPANRWAWVPQLSNLLLLVFVADASVALWRRGDPAARRRAMRVGGSLAACALVAAVFGYFVSPLLANLSRRHEFQADAYACAQASGADLAAALLKLHEDNASTLTPDPVYVKFYYSHPPASERLAAMQRGVGAPA